jgi:hypothetical protein
MKIDSSREYHTCDTSVGYPPGLTRERFISFARNTINRGIRKNTIHANTLFTQKHYYRKTLFPQNPQKLISRNAKNLIHEISRIHYSREDTRKRISTDCTIRSVLRFGNWQTFSYPYPSIYRLWKSSKWPKYPSKPTLNSAWPKMTILPPSPKFNLCILGFYLILIPNPIWA